MGAKNIFSETFNVNLNYLELSYFLKTGFNTYSSSAYSKYKKKMNQGFLFCGLKMHLKKFRRFSDNFSAIAFTAAADKFLANCFHILKGQSSY